MDSVSIRIVVRGTCPLFIPIIFRIRVRIRVRVSNVVSSIYKQ